MSLENRLRNANSLGKAQAIAKLIHKDQILMTRMTAHILKFHDVSIVGMKFLSMVWGNGFNIRHKVSLFGNSKQTSTNAQIQTPVVHIQDV